MAQRIEDYALIGDAHTAALVGRDGSMDWLCLPRFDSAACLAALLGDRDNGRWQIAPAAGGVATRRHYRDDTLILETEWDTPDGGVRLIDFMPFRGDSTPRVVRIVEGRSGKVPMRMDLTMRFDYGRTVPWVRRQEHVLTAVAGPNGIALHSDVPTYGKDLSTRADFTVGEGDRVTFVMGWYPSHLRPSESIDSRAALRDTERGWGDWAKSCRYEGPWREAVVRSHITLKALTYEPTGGIVAAPTMSLPELIGGERNWDYRFCWLRDATFTLYSLVHGGYRDEARRWRDWLLRAVAGVPEQIQILYGIGGERDIPETQIGWLAGYENSKPVRCGNAAIAQFQLDVFGELMDSMYAARRIGLDFPSAQWSLHRHLIEYLEKVWRNPDEGIWETRGGARKFTHSRVMAWVALDRSIKLAEDMRLQAPLDRWKAVRQEIHDDVCANGYDAGLESFVQSYGSKALDASLLLIPLVGFLPADDPRVKGTIRAIEKGLMAEGFVLRYRRQTSGKAGLVDGLPGGEGAFLPCTFWLADAYAQVGRRDEAVALFERLLSIRNDVGLLSEEYDPQARRMLGNFPQAFTHVALVNTASNLTPGWQGTTDHRTGRTHDGQRDGQRDGETDRTDGHEKGGREAADRHAGKRAGAHTRGRSS